MRRTTIQITLTMVEFDGGTKVVTASVPDSAGTPVSYVASDSMSVQVCVDRALSEIRNQAAHTLEKIVGEELGNYPDPVFSISGTPTTPLG